MVTCENCGASFEIALDPTEVSSLRVLCPKCDAERRERKRQAAAKAQPVPAKSPSPSPAKAPAPTPMRPEAAAPRAEAAPAPRAEVSARQASPPAARTSPVPRAAPAPAPRPAAAPGPRPTASRAPAAKPEPRSTARPAARPASSRRAEAAEQERPSRKNARSKDVMRETEELKKKEERTIKMGWMGAGLMLLIAAIAGVLALKKDSDIKAAIKKRLDDQEAIHTEALKFDVTTEDGARKLIDYLDSDKTRHALWIAEDNKWNADLLSARARAVNNIEVFEEKKTLRSTFDTVVKTLASASTLPPEEIVLQRRKLAEIDAKSNLLGPEFIAEVAKARTQIDRDYATRLLEDARSSAGQAKDTDAQRAALLKYAKAEDEVQRLLDESMSKQRKEAEEFFKTMYQDIIKESDALAYATFTPDVIEKVAWKNLLEGEQAGFWNTSKEGGFTVKIEKGVLTAGGIDAKAGIQGLTSIGDREQWRDFVLDFGFTIEKGEYDMAYRLGKAVSQATTLKFSADAEKDNALQPGENYTAQLTVIGSKEALQYTDGEANDANISWIKTRKGAIGLTVPGGTTIKITRMRIKVLR